MGKWIQLRQRSSVYEENLDLVALKNGHPIGTAILNRGQNTVPVVDVEAPYLGSGIEKLLREAAQEWLQWQTDAAASKWSSR
jgi:hypothetical protein